MQLVFQATFQVESPLLTIQNIDAFLVRNTGFISSNSDGSAYHVYMLLMEMQEDLGKVYNWELRWNAASVQLAVLRLEDAYQRKRFKSYDASGYVLLDSQPLEGGQIGIDLQDATNSEQWLLKMNKYKDLDNDSEESDTRDLHRTQKNGSPWWLQDIPSVKQVLDAMNSISGGDGGGGRIPANEQYRPTIRAVDVVECNAYAYFVDVLCLHYTNPEIYNSAVVIDAYEKRDGKELSDEERAALQRKYNPENLQPTDNLLRSFWSAKEILNTTGRAAKASAQAVDVAIRHWGMFRRMSFKVPTEDLTRFPLNHTELEAYIDQFARRANEKFEDIRRGIGAYASDKRKEMMKTLIDRINDPKYKGTILGRDPKWAIEPVATFKHLAKLLGIPMYPRSDARRSSFSSPYKKEFNIQRRRWLRSFQNRVGTEHPRILYSNAYIQQCLDGGDGDDGDDEDDEEAGADGADGADGVEPMGTLDGAGEGNFDRTFELLLSDYFHDDRDTLHGLELNLAPPGAPLPPLPRLPPSQLPMPFGLVEAGALWELRTTPVNRSGGPAPTYPVADVATGRFMELARNQYFNKDQGGNGDCLYRNLAFLAGDEYGLQMDSVTLHSRCNTWLSVDLDRESQNPEMVARVALASTLRANVNYELFPNAAPGFLRETVSRLVATHGREPLRNMSEDDLMKAFAQAHNDPTDWGELPNITAAAWVLRAEVYVYKQSTRHAPGHLAFSESSGPTDSNRKLFLYNAQARHFAAIVPRRENDNGGAVEMEIDSSTAFDEIDVLETYQSRRKKQRR